MSCILRISGKDFDARAYARRTSLPVVKVYMRGEPRFWHKPTGKKNINSGVNVEVSRAEFENPKRQIRDAIAFLVKHRRAVQRLRNTVGVEEITLDFAIADREVAAQFDYFPPELIRSAGSLGIGIEVSRYHAFAGG
jgi:hypothetical protein